MTYKEKLRVNLPSGLVDVYRSVKIKARHAAQWPSARFHPHRLESIQHLNEIHNRYLGERCVVIGNGPSLNQMDLSLIKDEFTFGMNRVYLGFEDWGFSTSFLVAVNNLVVEQSREDLLALDLPKYISWHAHNLLLPEGERPDQTYFIYTTYGGEKFARHAAGRLWEGATVTYVCLQLAYHMGFEEVILIGVDHNFQTSGEANQTVVSQGADPNHFREEYFGEGFRWQLPDLETSERAYQLAKAVFEAEGRKIFDGTIDGNLAVFPKIDYYSIFGK
jgi:hypothetical protein